MRIATRHAAKTDIDRWISCLQEGYQFRRRVRIGVTATYTSRESPFESFGIVYLESWREGTPVIACNRGASSRLVDPFRDGLLVRDADAFELAGAILTLLRDPELRKRMGMRGRAKVRERFDWEMIADRYEEFFSIWGRPRKSI